MDTYNRGRRSVSLLALFGMMAVLLANFVAPASAQVRPWMNVALTPDERAELLLQQMTLEEKADLMTAEFGETAYFNAPIPRLGIPALRMADAGAGIAPRGWSLPGTGNRATAMPSGIALAATWDPRVVAAYAGVVADEARQTGHNVLLGPNADIVRLPWWGRIAESASEDPLLTSRVVVPFVREVQARNVIANLKHYNLYNQETNRGTGQNSIADERTIQEIYTPPWAAAIREADLGSVMCAFNKVNGIFSCENEHLLDDILREQLGFRGFVLADFGAVHSTIPSLQAGLDLETGIVGLFYGQNLVNAVRSGQISESLIDRSVLRILRTMFAIGLFDTSYAPSAIPVAEHGAVARQVEEQAITLLKNTNGALPLTRSQLRSVAVIGGDANITAALGGASRVEPTYQVSPLDGIRARVGSSVQVRYEQGTDPVNAASMLPGPQAVPSSVLSTPGGERGLRAEWFNNTTFSGSPTVVRTERQVNPDFGFLSTFEGLNPSQVPPPPVSGSTATGSVRYTGSFTAPATGPYTFALTGWGDAQMYFDGQLLIDMTGQNGLRSVSSRTLSLVAGQPHQIRITFATTRPRVMLEPGTLQLGWTHPTNAIAPGIQAAAQAARQSDVAIVFARTHEGEQRDRFTLSLANEQDLLIQEVVKANPRTIVVLATGGPILMPWLNTVPAVLQSYFGGQEQGTAIARVLFGDVNPSGRLPITYPRSETAVPPGLENPWATENDLDVEYDEGIFVGYRGYDQFGIDPLFPFGYGLSYTSFTYDSLQVAPNRTDGSKEIRVHFNVKNTGARAGTETAQVYLTLPSSTGEPPKRLVGWTKVTLNPGETRRVTVAINPTSVERPLSYWNTDTNSWQIAPGTYTVHVGASSRDIRLSADLFIDPTGCLPHDEYDPCARFQTTLTGAAEVPGPGDPDGTGTAIVTLRLERSTICFTLNVARITLPASAAHIHRGEPGIAGPVVVPLSAPDADGSASGCVSVEPALLEAIALNPERFYVNVHTTDYPAGAVRGQLATPPPSTVRATYFPMVTNMAAARSR